MKVKTVIKKATALFVIVAMMLPVFSEYVYAVEKAMTPIVAGNDFVEYTVNQTNGRFSIRTTQGSPWKEGDDGQPLLYDSKVPETSFTTFRIDGEDYVYGNDYGFLSGDGYFSAGVTNYGYTTQSKWNVKGVEITQQIHLYEDSANPYVGNVKITYAIKNTNETSKEIGTRLLLDTMLGANDGSPIVLDGESEYIYKETELTGKDIPNYWRATDDPLAPKVLSYGFLDGWGNTKPSKMVIGHWDGLSETKWDYSVDPHMNFTSDRNEYGTGDSAVALYWEPLTVDAGQEIIYETYYGLGNFYEDKDRAGYGVQVNAPEKLTLNENKEGYVEEPFDIIVEIDNSYDDAKLLENVQLSLGTTEGIEIISANEVQKVGSINPGEVKTYKWTMTGLPQDIYKACQYVVTISATGVQNVVKGGYVVLPALSGKPPEVQVLSVTPDKVYYEEDERNISLVGKGFEILKADNDWTMVISRIRDGKTASLGRDKVTISDDNNISTVTDNAYWKDNFNSELGLYTITLNAGKYGSYTKVIEITNDVAYLSRSYGVLLVIGNKISPDRYGDYETGQETYEIVTVDDAKTYDKERYEDFLPSDSSFKNDSQILLEFVGDIKELNTATSTEYYIKPGCYINSVLEYSSNDIMKTLFGETSQKLVIKDYMVDGKKQGVKVSGNGILSIPHFPFVTGNFSILLEDETRYSLDADEENGEEAIEVEWDVLKGMKYISHVDIFPVTIQNARIGDKAVSFGGSLYLNLGGSMIKKKDDGEKEDDGEFKDYDDPFGESLSVGINLEELKFGTYEEDGLFFDAGEFGFMGLRASGSAGMPKDYIPGIKFGADASFIIDTLDQIYEVQLDIDFKAVTFGGLLTLRFTDQGIPVPDNIKGYAGFEPGIPIVPPVPPVFITKGGVGIENIYDTVTLGFNYLPPLKLSVVGSADIAKVLEASDVTGEVSLRGFKLSCDIAIAKLDLFRDLHAQMMFTDEGGGGYLFEAGGGINVFDFIVGEVTFAYGFDKGYMGVAGPHYMYGQGIAEVQVPTFVPIVGGLGLGGVALEISTKHAYVEPRILGIPVAIEYEWGKKGVSTEHGESKLEAMTTNGLAQQVYYNSETGIASDTMTFGTNISKVATVANVERFMANDLEGNGLIASATDEYMFSLASGFTDISYTIHDQDAIVFEIEYEDEVPEIECYKPDGTKYDLITNVNYRVQEIPADESLSGKLERRVYITAVKPDNGDWVIKSNQLVTVSLLNVTDPANISELKVEPKADHHEFSVEWNSSNISGEKVALYLCDDQNTIGHKLVEGINASSGSYDGVIADSFASGDYYIKAVLYKDETSYMSISSNNLELIDPHQPTNPTDLQVSPVGNGLFKAVWAQSDQLDGYYIDFKDENGVLDLKAGEIEVDGQAREAYIGGTFEDLDGNLMGLIPGHSYILSISGYKEVDGVKHFSEMTNSQVFYLPQPNPATLTCRVDPMTGESVLGSDASGRDVYGLNNTMATITVDSNQLVETKVILNNEDVDTLSGTRSVFDLDLVEGENLIQVIAVNEDGDTSTKGIVVKCDSTPPELKVNEVVEGLESFLIKGVTEIGADLKLDGQAIDVNADGQFEVIVDMSNTMKRNISLVAKDYVGNTTSHEMEIYNQEVKDLSKIEIRAVRTSTKDDVYVGEDLVLQAYCIDTEGQEYLMTGEDIDWSVLVGDGVGDISEDGILSLRHTGAIIIKASYLVSDKYAFEDTITLNAVTGSQDYDQDYEGSEFTIIETSKTKKSTRDNEEVIIDELLAQVLSRLIMNENNMTLLKHVWLDGVSLKTFSVDNIMTLMIPQQDFEDLVGLGLWRVEDKEMYQRSHLNFFSDIYEIVLDSPRKLDNKASLSFEYDPGEVDDPSALGIYWYDEVNGRWEYVGGEVDLVKHTVRVELSHFSKYALLTNDNLVKFKDIQGRWSEDTINRLASIGIINGVSMNSGYYYKPTDQINRQEFIKLLTQAIGYDMDAAVELEYFEDQGQVDQWALPYMKAAVEENLVKGSEIGGKLYLNPLDYITRAEATVMVGRILKAQNDSTMTLDFIDESNIPTWARGYVRSLSDLGVIQGYPDLSFRGNNSISREEAATIILNMLEALR